MDAVPAYSTVRNQIQKVPASELPRLLADVVARCLREGTFKGKSIADVVRTLETQLGGGR